MIDTSLDEMKNENNESPHDSAMQFLESFFLPLNSTGAMPDLDLLPSITSTAVLFPMPSALSMNPARKISTNSHSRGLVHTKVARVGSWHLDEEIEYLASVEEDAVGVACGIVGPPSNGGC